MATATETNDAFTAFWNDVLAAKFERFRNILLDGLSYHSKVPLAKLKLPAGAHAVDVGCGWGDTAIELAHKVGPRGSVCITANAADARMRVSSTPAILTGGLPLHPRSRP